MGTEIFLVAVGFLLLFAVFDLVVGVSNDAVNFLNSSLGSRVAPYYVIMIIASLGILAGVTFSGGMMEVARKGIFHPQFFTMPELITIFLAVMFTDILLLDMFNTYGLPTSTTVSIVFELLGAAVAVSAIKVMQSDVMTLGEYINTTSALTIIAGILLSIVVAFICGAVFQFFTRILFTFDYERRIKRYGALWGGFAMTSIAFFILLKGAKGATFITPEALLWIKQNTLLILAMTFAASAVLLQICISLFRINILKPIVLVGTFALAMAFAANDLVNFIGVPLAGLGAYTSAMASADPLNVTMSALSKAVQPDTLILLIAGAVMVTTLWVSRKARTVTETEISLGQQEEGTERFESIWLSRAIVRMGASSIATAKSLVPMPVRDFVRHRIDPASYERTRIHDKRPSFDLIRASVNLMVASMVVSFATSLKLPLSTTYVTFMVAMGTSFSDQAWGRESAVYRITGVLTVVGGWFMTAFIAFVVAFIFAGILFYLKVLGVFLLLLFVGYAVYKNHREHRVREQEKEEADIFVLHNVTDADMAISKTFEHLAAYLKEMHESLDKTFEALFTRDLDELGRQRKKVKQIQNWSNIITANIFKALRVMQRMDDIEVSASYTQIIRRLQRLSDGYRDIVLRSYMHIGNHHKGLLPDQVQELKQIKNRLFDILSKTEHNFATKDLSNYPHIEEQFNSMRTLEDRCNQEQIRRIGSEGTSKTRLSILFYALMGNCILIAKQNVKLLTIFNESLGCDKELCGKYINVEPGKPSEKSEKDTSRKKASEEDPSNSNTS
ncbi:MAG: inorganic phosphate transporter [Desulfovibrionales bacterium]